MYDMKTKKWNEIHRDTRITLLKDTILKSFNGEKRELKAGRYYITGFWVDMCGLSTIKPYDNGNEVCIQSRELVAFEGII